MVVPDLPDLHPAIWPQVAEPHRPAWGPGPFPWGCAVWPACRVTLCGTAQVRVRLSEAQETLLVTLCGRAWGARARQPILGNTMAAAAIEQMDYDFRRRRSTRGWRPRSQFVPSISTTDGGVSRRARPGHRGPPGCRAGHPGLAGQPRARRDLVRRRLPRGHRAAEHVLPERGHYHMIGSSVTAPSWLAQVPADRPALIVADGLTMYLKPEEGHELMRRRSRALRARDHRLRRLQPADHPGAASQPGGPRLRSQDVVGHRRPRRAGARQPHGCTASRRPRPSILPGPPPCRSAPGLPPSCSAFSPAPRHVPVPAL